VVCLSKQFNQAGFRQKEVRLALDTAMEKPEGEIFIIPARLEVCDNLDSLRRWHWVDLFEDDGYERLLNALRARAGIIRVPLKLKNKSSSGNLKKNRARQSSNKRYFIIAVLSIAVILFFIASLSFLPLLDFSSKGDEATPTSTNEVANTPTQNILGDACNSSTFLSDVTIPDGTEMKPGQEFTKVWQVKNSGTCTWDSGYTLVYIGGNIISDSQPFNVYIDTVFAEEITNVGVELVAPAAPGTYEGHWRLRSDLGYFFGSILSTFILVKP